MRNAPVFCSLCTLLLLLLLGCASQDNGNAPAAGGSASQQDYNQLKSQYAELSASNSKNIDDYNALLAEYNNLSNAYYAQANQTPSPYSLAKDIPATPSIPGISFILGYDENSIALVGTKIFITGGAESGSMIPTLSGNGTVIITKSFDPHALQVGQIIGYHHPVLKDKPGSFIAHRIIRIIRTPDGEPCYITKGDANGFSDDEFPGYPGFCAKPSDVDHVVVGEIYTKTDWTYINACPRIPNSIGCVYS